MGGMGKSPGGDLSPLAGLEGGARHPKLALLLTRAGNSAENVVFVDLICEEGILYLNLVLNF